MSDPKDAAELMQEAEQEYQQKREEQQAVLDTVAEEDGADVLETTCNIAGDHTVPLKAKLNGKVLDQMGALEARFEDFEDGNVKGYEIGETADDMAQMLADVVDSPEWDKQTFYGLYEKEGLEPIGKLLIRALNSLLKERERQQGAAEGFRAT